MVKPKSARQVKALKGCNHGMDRISNLPEALLSRILSLLPTEEVVATSVLSTRWKFLWTSSTTLEFRSPGNYWFKPENFNISSKKFTLFVNRVLILLNPPSIQNFCLKCYQDGFDPRYLNSWISAAFGRTVGELDLSFRSNEILSNEALQLLLPLSHSYCNVAVLKLDGNIEFNIPAAATVCFPSLQALHLKMIKSAIAGKSSVSFPNLKTMHLSHVEFDNEDSVQKLFSSSPVLDELVIKKDIYDGVERLIIRIPSLTRLSIGFDDLSDYKMHKLQIDSPALEYLTLIDDLPCEYLPSGNLSNLLQANVKITFYSEDVVNVESCICIIKFIEGLSNVKFLSVSSAIPKALRIASANISTSFQNLTRLEITVEECFDLSVMINTFLESMDNLEHLVVMKEWDDVCFSCPSWWNEPLNVPKCLMSRVTTVSFSDNFFYCGDQLEVLSYLLKNAQVLQMLTIGTKRIAEKRQLELVKKISLIPRESRTCQVAFTE